MIWRVRAIQISETGGPDVLTPPGAVPRARRRGPYPLPDARAAHEDLQSRRTTGKLLLLP